MSQISQLYLTYLDQCNLDLNKNLTGGQNKEALLRLLQDNLPQHLFFHAEELLNNFGLDMEEGGFRAGARSILSLCVDVLEQK